MFMRPVESPLCRVSSILIAFLHASCSNRKLELSCSCMSNVRYFDISFPFLSQTFHPFKSIMFVFLWKFTMSLKIFKISYKVRYLLTFFILSSRYLPCTNARFLLLTDLNSQSWTSAFERGLKEYDEVKGKSFDYKPVFYRNETNMPEVCQQISNGITAVIDATQQIGDMESKPQTFFVSKSIPYFKLELPIDSSIRGMDAMLQAKNGSNGFLIFFSDLYVNRGIQSILGNTLIRYSFLDATTQLPLIIEKFDYRVPSAVILFGKKQEFDDFIKNNWQVVRNRTEWIFMHQNFYDAVPPLNVTFPHFRGVFDGSSCCKLKNPSAASSAVCIPASCNDDITEQYLKKIAFTFSQVIHEVDLDGKRNIKISCNEGDRTTGDVAFTKTLSDALNKNGGDVLKVTEKRISLLTPLKFDDHFNGTSNVTGTYTSGTGFVQNPQFQFRERPRYFRIGIVDYKPWTFKDENGEWTGYCIDLARGIADKMNFTYDLIESKGFGRRSPDNGRWDGLTGDLVHGKIDIAVAAYIMTSEREEFIDFVSPYYEQSGLIITMKRPVVKNSLFKFMTVLRTEVWLSIAGATIATGFMLWFLDKFSPYSAQNNPHKYKTFRKFTLKESFWFALTSFTPQGGGEPPKAFSGRTLVAAYWIFVVLMLATFTANLAAFLTVERMQSPIRNLEHLAAQSSVKYSVVNVSTAMTFFRNMAHAEETLYQMWRNLTLRAPSSAREYVVWEYPIREMYIHIFSVIQKTKPVDNYTDGFNMAMGNEYYAFIHDAAQTRFEVYRNCNLTLIGEPFAEAPYAIAVAQGNPLQDDISMAILQLQTARFFESLSAKYWTSQCPNLGEGESDGISLESLGGVFIATIIGLGIAFISLAIEVFTTARNRRKAKIEADNMIKPKFIGPMDFYGASKGVGQTQNKADVFRRTNFLPEVIN